MNKNLSILTVITLGAFLMSACAQTMPAAASGPGQPVVVTAVPAVSGKPLSEMTPETPTASPNDSSNTGQKTVTRDDNGKTISMVVGENFLLKLGAEYTWEITVSDQNVLSRAKNIAVIEGAQGVYNALQAGTVTVSAAGDPLCRKSKPACGMPSVQVDFTVTVK